MAKETVTRVNGKVLWYQPHKGYGFIQGDDGVSYYAHHSQIVMDGFRKLKGNQTVSFVVEENDKGLAALDIHVE